MKKLLLKTASFFLSLLPSGSIESIYRTLSKIKLIKILINSVVTAYIPEKIRVGNLNLFLNQKDAVVSGSLAMGIYEPYESKLFSEKVKNGMVIVDIGANIGYYTLLSAEKAKRVISFEPDLVSFSCLQKNVQKNNLKNVAIYQMAISEKSGVTHFYKNQHNFGDSRIYSFKEGEESNEIKTISLDEFVNINKIEKIDLIKMDIQGAEGLALLGMKETITKWHPDIFIEFFPKGLISCGTNPKELIQSLFDYQYEVFKIDDKLHSLEQIKDTETFISKFKDAEYCNLYCQKTK